MLAPTIIVGPHHHCWPPPSLLSCEPHIDVVLHNHCHFSHNTCTRSGIECVCSSPKDTPFEDGTFKLTMQFTEEYPNKPPLVRFVSKMFHPNGECHHWKTLLKLKSLCLWCSPVYADGSICLDILQNRWSPTYDVSSILTSIQVS